MEIPIECGDFKSNRIWELQQELQVHINLAHVDSLDSKQLTQVLVGENELLVLLILEVVELDVLPERCQYLRSRRHFQPKH